MAALSPFLKSSLTLLCGVLVSLSALGQTAPSTPGQELHKEPARKGWFWYLDPKEEKKPELAPVVIPPPVEPQKGPAQPVVIISGGEAKEDPCLTAGSWTAECGFIDPGNDFDFQAKQRDILLQQMSINPGNPDAVEAAQRYMKWVVTKASMAANMWHFNMIQNPELDPTVKNPISEVGIALASRVSEASQYEYFRLIREEGGVLFYFTRNDCIYCHDQQPYAMRVARTMGLQLINIPLDGICLKGFEGDDCGDNITEEQIAILNVQIVPAMYLYVPSNTWIRLGTGVVADSTILANTVNFFSAYRAAMLQGLDNSKGARPSVTFDPAHNQRSSGAASATAPTANSQPSQEQMMKLLGY